MEFFLRLNIKFPNVLEGAVVIMDNHAAHHSHTFVSFMRLCKADVLFLPPTTSMFNPVETVFAEMKKKLRNAMHNCKLELRNRVWMRNTVQQIFENMNMQLLENLATCHFKDIIHYLEGSEDQDDCEIWRYRDPHHR